MAKVYLSRIAVNERKIVLLAVKRLLKTEKKLSMKQEFAAVQVILKLKAK